MTAGRRHDLVTLQRFTTTTDDYGEDIQTWADVGTEWAAVFYGRGSERRQAAMEQGSQTATFQMVSNERTRGLALTNRIVLDGFAWDIVGIAPDTPKRGLIEFTASATGEEAES